MLTYIEELFIYLQSICTIKMIIIEEENNDKHYKYTVEGSEEFIMESSNYTPMYYMLLQVTKVLIKKGKWTQALEVYNFYKDHWCYNNSYDMNKVGVYKWPKLLAIQNYLNNKDKKVLDLLDLQLKHHV